MVEPFSVIKALSITPTAVGKSMSVLAKGLIGFAVVFALGWAAWGLYAGLVRPVLKPPTTVKNEAERIDTYTVNTPKVYFGCMSLQVRDALRNATVKDK